MKKLLLLSMLALLSIVACKKDDAEPDNTTTNTDNNNNNGNGGTTTDTTTTDTTTTDTTDTNNGNNNNNGNNTGNTSPVATDDVVTTDRATQTTFNVLSNDSDAEQDALSITSYTSPSSGVLSKNSDNTFTFAPNSSDVGTFSFTYTITDGTNNTTGTVTINVTKTSKEIATETLIGNNLSTRIHRVSGMTIWGRKSYITFDTTAKTVSVNFAQKASTIHFTMSNTNPVSYIINPQGQLVIADGVFDGVVGGRFGATYNVTTGYNFNGLSGLTFTPTTKVVNTSFQMLNENK